MVEWHHGFGPRWALSTSAKLSSAKQSPATLDLLAVCLCTCPFHHQELGPSIEHSISTLPAMEDALMNYLMLLTLARLLLLGAGG